MLACFTIASECRSEHTKVGRLFTERIEKLRIGYPKMRIAHFLEKSNLMIDRINISPSDGISLGP